jgi:hypothetical protein
MLKSLEWTAIAALAILIFSIIGVSCLSSPEPSEPTEQQASAQSENEQNPQKQHPIRRIIRFLFPDGIALFTFFLVLATIALWRIAITQTEFLKRGERIAQDSARAAKDAAEAAQQSTKVTATIERPWIAAPSVIIGRDGAGLSFTLVFKNVGRSPTNGLYIDAKIVSWQEASDEAARQCSVGIVKAEDPFFRKPTSVPGSDFLIRNTPSDPGLGDVSIDALRKIGGPHIAGCVLYGSPFDSKLHHSIFLIPITIKGDVVSYDLLYTYEAD